MPKNRITVHYLQRIAEDSWLNDPQYAWFVEGYEYAQTQTRAIEALSACSPEALYFAVWAIIRGAGLPDPEKTEVACTRSHPHENMSPLCVLRTEIARLQNELAISPASEQEEKSGR